MKHRMMVLCGYLIIGDNFNTIILPYPIYDDLAQIRKTDYLGLNDGVCRLATNEALGIGDGGL